MMLPVELPMRKLDPDASELCYAHDGDAGLDLVSVEDLVIEPGQRAMVHCGIAIAIPDGHCGLVIPRSGLAAKHGVTVLNSPGLIDSGYRGEICVVLLNTDGQHPFTIERGMRIAQLMILEIPEVAVKEVSQLDITSRNAGGFGSSGIRVEERS